MTDILERLQGLVGVYIGDADIDDDILAAKAEIERLRAALQAIAQCPIPVRIPGRVELWSLAVQMQETAIAALKEGEKKDE